MIAQLRSILTVLGTYLKSNALEANGSATFAKYQSTASTLPKGCRHQRKPFASIWSNQHWHGRRKLSSFWTSWRTTTVWESSSKMYMTFLQRSPITSSRKSCCRRTMVSGLSQKYYLWQTSSNFWVTVNLRMTRSSLKKSLSCLMRWWKLKRSTWTSASKPQFVTIYFNRLFWKTKCSNMWARIK